MRPIIVSQLQSTPIIIDGKKIDGKIENVFIEKITGKFVSVKLSNSRYIQRDSIVSFTQGELKARKMISSCENKGAVNIIGHRVEDRDDNYLGNVDDFMLDDVNYSLFQIHVEKKRAGINFLSEAKIFSWDMIDEITDKVVIIRSDKKNLFEFAKEKMQPVSIQQSTAQFSFSRPEKS